MRTILVSLISEQTIPNFELIKEKEDQIDALLFVTTDAMEKTGNRNWILYALGEHEFDVLPPIIVDAFSFEDIENKLSTIINDDDFYIVNLTGGTKIMSLAVHDYFMSVNSEMYYLTGNGQYIKIHPGRSKTMYELKSKTTLKDYILAYGFSIKDQSEPLKEFVQSKSILNYFLNKYDKVRDNLALEQLRLLRSKGLKNLEENEEIQSFLERIGFVEEVKGKLSRYECRYLSGDWLEEYLFYFLKENLKITENEIGLSWIVEKREIKNEFDVLVMRNNKLYLFECKTSIYIDSDESQTFIGETIYKSDSLRNKVGLFAQTIVFTLSDLDNPKLKNHIERAKTSKVKMIGKLILENEEMLKEVLFKI